MTDWLCTSVSGIPRTPHPSELSPYYPLSPGAMGQIPHPLGWLVPQWVSHSLNSVCPHTPIHTDSPSLCISGRVNPCIPSPPGVSVTRTQLLPWTHPCPGELCVLQIDNAWTLFTEVFYVLPFKFSTPFICSIKLFKGYINLAIRLRWNLLFSVVMYIQM